MDHQTSQVTGRPYSEKKEDGYLIREFSQDTPSFEFVWHRDKYDREINIISGENWFLQIQHELPKRMNAGQCMFIRKKVWHRVFCINSNEKNDLVISILELNQEEE